MNKPEFYPYVLLPEEIEKTKIEGIPVPEIKELPKFPEKTRKRFLGTIILLVSIAVILLINLTKILKGHYSLANGITFFAFFIAIVSLTAMVFEILHNSKAKKQHRIAIKLYEELKAEREHLKQKRTQAIDDNNNPKAIEAYRHDTINKYFKYSYNKIQAVQRDQSAAHKRFMVFLEQYFEGKILENIRLVHEPKKLDYTPSYLLKLENPKVNIAIDIEEPYQYEGTKVVVKKNKAEDLFKIRYRVTNELRWVSIVFSEEQIVSHPTEACKLIAHTIDEIVLKEKYSPKFKGVEKIKRVEIPGQRELSMLIRNKHREKYLTAAGLIDDLSLIPAKTEKKGDETKLSEKTVKAPVKDLKLSEKVIKETEKNKTPINKVEGKKTDDKNNSLTKQETEKKEIEKTQKHKIVDLKSDLIKKEDEKKTIVKKETEKKPKIEDVEQLQIVKKVTDRLRSEKKLTEQKDEKKIISKRSNQDPGKSLAEKKKELKEENVKKVKTEQPKVTEIKKNEKVQSTSVKKGQLKREADILNKLYESEKDTKAKVEKTMGEEKVLEKDKEKSTTKANELTERMLMEKERLEKKKQEHEQLLNLRKSKEKEAAELLEKKKQNLELVENELVNKEKREKERKEKVKLEIERLAKGRTAKDQDRKEQLQKELLAKKKIEQAHVEKEREAKAKSEKIRIENEKIAKEKERIAKEKVEMEFQAKKKQIKAKEDEERLEKEKQVKVQREKERLEVEKLQKELDRKAEIAENIKLMDQQKAEIEVLVVKKEWDKLLGKCNELIKKYPYWDWPYYRRSTVNGNKGKFKEVLADCNKALGINPKFADAYYNRATAKFFLEKYAEAVEDYQKCIDFDYKNTIDAYFNKGLCYQNLNYSKKAHDEFVKAKNLGSSKADDMLKQNYPDG